MSVTKKPAPSAAKDRMKVPPIIAAKMQTPSQTTTQNSLPAGVTVETGAPLRKKNLVDHMFDRNDNSVADINQRLRTLDPSALNEQFGKIDLSFSDKKLRESITPEEKAKGGAKVVDLDKETLGPGVRLNSVLMDLYKKADEGNIKTAAQFATNFDQLLKTANPKDVAFLKKYANGGQAGMIGGVDLEKLKWSAGTDYQNQAKKRDEEHAATEAKRPPVGTVTDNMKASYKDMPAYTKAQAPGSIGMLDNANKTPVKLSVKKK